MKPKSWIGIIAVIAIAFITTTLPAAAGDEGTLVGTVTDPTGAVLGDAQVWIRWNDTSGLLGEGRRAKVPPRRELRLRTDANGEFRVRLGPGWYDVFIYRDSLHPACASAFVDPANVQHLKLQLSHFLAPVE